MRKKYKITQEEIKYLEDDWICDKCKNAKYHLCDCGNKICSCCGYVHKGPYPCYILLNH